ncbi:hypothetical protein Vadar_027809 [Vaccinium darrowii]|uniref:Uncharacterized protein n=1 Tax=Vaccinium darrowii TaxID=229202 RepID=A0ACB7X4S0_9ERIC|nr:hypothetical protein Vadar_027809 [Vaccinium darrowii]
MDGLYVEENNQSTCSSGSHARRLFDEYRQSVLFVRGIDGVPGLAFKNGVPYMELKLRDLRRLATLESQLQFYQEARIKTAIFMGCKTGEIELGISNDTQVNLEMEMRNWFPDNFARQIAPPIELPHPTDQPRPSSSSSSLTSLSRGSPEVSPFLFSIPNTSSLLEPPVEAPIEQALRPIPTSSLSPFTQIPTFQLPTLETREATTTEAGTSLKPSAFKKFRSVLRPSTTTVAAGVRKPNIQKRAIAFFRGLRLTRIQGQVQGTRPSSLQLHHMISERKRREQLNKTFQALRSLLPPGTKKDKASVLASTLDYIASLKSQVEELTKRSNVLEEKVQPLTTKKEANDQQEAVSLSPNQRPDVRITHEAESPSQAQVIGLQVVLRGECNVMDLVTRILGVLRQVENASLMSVEADTQVVDSNPMNVVRLILRIEDVNAEVGKPQKRQREQLLGALLGLKDDKQGLEQEVVALLRKHITEQIQGMTELQEKERVGISYCESTVGTAPEGGVLSMEEVVKLNEIGEAVKKRQKLFPEGKESSTKVSDEVSLSLEEELLEEISLKELEEAHSDVEELEELDCDPVEVPPTISHHFSILRMLDLSYTVIKCLPQSISRLVALQKLFLRNCELLMELPPEIGELTNLEVLDLEQTEIRFLPKEIAKLVNLTCLKVSFYGYANQIVIPRRVLPNLSRLNELIIDVTPYGEWWDVEVEAIIDDLCSLKELRTLKLYLPTAKLLEDLALIFPGLANFRFTLGRHEEHFISCLPHALEEEFNNWEKLEKGLKYINGNCIPHEITKVFKNANAFFLQRHWTAESLSEFGHENMNAVKFCLVMECNEFRTIIDSKQFYQGKDRSSESGDFQDFENAIVLASLEKLVILYMKNLESIWKGPVGTGSLSNLKSLALHTCPCLTTLFTIDMLNNLRNLEELIVEDCPKIDSLVSLKSSGSNSGCFLSNLKKISLLELPKLASISSGLFIAPKLERMVIFYCPKLEKLSTMDVSSTNLKVIKGEKEWWEALKWYESDLSMEHEDFLARLFIPLRRDGDLMAQLTKD